jgi:Domain of unknown function (DUF4397)
MSRLLKILPLTLALAALSIFASSCGSGTSQVRVINSIPQSPDLDVDINGTKYFPSVETGFVYPTPTTPVSYISVPAGGDTIEAFDAGTTSDAVVPSQSISLGGSTQYTVVLGGFITNNPQAYLITDDNTVPATGYVNIRVIDGSATAGNNGIDAILYPQGTTPGSKQVTGLVLGQASAYLPLTFEEGGYCIEVFNTGNDTPLFNYCTFAQSTGSITTLVIVDNDQTGIGISAQPLVYLDVE